ncbi:MAG: NADP-dependent malic enzyme [Candidatus Woesearchaeota archaeon]|jgi:malate dehydrogenase (oxaloacetate-decarboxylating)|nr:NADP-dependent malic enzyme [Candidatus Woesearchaeota archaeon]MDP7623186.1 NADP-dependent malic enzyme [Candidatus Woesearchaeota archaeon]|tara:strand:+ start:188 stop:1420 length:1233 start_codon:yes stop_codon:yes gene_type:complete
MDLNKLSLEMHKKKKGKLVIKSKVNVKNKLDLSIAYTPGVAEVCRKIADDPKEVYEYTIKKNTVAVVSDGSAVLGLGNIGAEASIPVMEGKCILMKEFAGIDAFPICVKTQKSDEIIELVKNIAPVFGGINLEDISAPRCFEIEEKLQDIGIPVFHDDQHGTAVVALAAIINSAKIVNKKMKDLKIVINGAGAAGIAVAKLLLCMGIDKKICTRVKDIILLDSQGVIHHCRDNLNEIKKVMAVNTNARCNNTKHNPKDKKCQSCIKGGLKEAITGTDVFIGVSVANILTKEMVKSMNKDSIILAMANPIPEIMPNQAKEAGAAIVGTGRSDFPNQINNVLAFPGIFKGALEAGAVRINHEMKIAAAYALAVCQKNPTPKKILPEPFDENVAKKVSEAVKKTAIETGAVRK